MDTKRKVEIFSAGCPLCEDAVKLVKQIACSSCEVTVMDMNNPEVKNRAEELGISSVPAVVIDGKIADCCKRPSPDEKTLRALGLGKQE